MSRFVSSLFSKDCTSKGWRILLHTPYMINFSPIIIKHRTIQEKISLNIIVKLREWVERVPPSANKGLEWWVWAKTHFSRTGVDALRFSVRKFSRIITTSSPSSIRYFQLSEDHFELLSVLGLRVRDRTTLHTWKNTVIRPTVMQVYLPHLPSFHQSNLRNHHNRTVASHTFTKLINSDSHRVSEISQFSTQKLGNFSYFHFRGWSLRRTLRTVKCLDHYPVRK